MLGIELFSGLLLEWQKGKTFQVAFPRMTEEKSLPKMLLGSSGVGGHQSHLHEVPWECSGLCSITQCASQTSLLVNNSLIDGSKATDANNKVEL